MPRFAKPEEIDNSYTARQLISDSWKYLHPHRGRFFFASLIAASRNLVSLYPAYAFARIINIISGPNPASHIGEVHTLLLLFIAAAIWQTVSLYIYRTTSNIIIDQVGLQTEKIAIRHLFMLNIGWHERENSGNKMRRMNSGLGGIQQALRIWINDITGMITSLVGVIVIISQFNPFIGWVLVLYVLIYYSISRSISKQAAAAANEVNIQSEKTNGLEFQAVNNIRTVKIMDMKEPFLARLQVEFATMHEKVRNRIFVFEKRGTLLSVWTQLVRVCVVVYLIYGVVNGHYEVGFLVLFQDYFGRMRELADHLSNIEQEVIISRFSVNRLNQMLAEPITIDDDTAKSDFPQQWQQISLRDVSFTYGNDNVLSNVNLQIRRGEKIGIIGLSGAGKSTLFKLLLKEYEDFSGNITFDEHDIRSIKKSDYFKHVAVVLQDTEVFNFSVKENITLANDEEKDNQELLQRSLEISHVQDFLHKLPEGMESMIGEKGVKLSGGERQRLGIARAVFKQPQILLLDEATSHLDVESEEKIKDSLNQFFHEVTAIVIAHRLTTVKAMDRIYVLENGKILESGSFDELYKKKGRFYELWEKQKL